MTRLREVKDTPSIAGVLPPHDIDAEEIIISDVVLKPGNLPIAMALLKPSSFYSDRNREIWKAIVAVSESDRKLDAAAVAAVLKDSGKLQFCGGFKALMDMIDTSPSVANVEQHAQRVADMAALRLVVSDTQAKTAELYFTGPDGAQAIVADLQDKLTNFGTATQKNSLVHLDDALTEGVAEVFRTQARNAAGTVSGIRTSLHTLDKTTTGLHPSDLLFIGGPKGGGKTSLACQIALSAARQVEIDTDKETGKEIARWQLGVACFSMEMKRSQYAMRFACAGSGIDFHRLRNGEATGEDFTRLLSAKEDLAGVPILIDGTTELTPIMLAAKVRRARADLAKRGARLRVVIVDYLQLMEPSTPKTDRDTEESVVGKLGLDLRRLSLKEDDISWIVLTQLNAKGELRGSRALDMHATSVWTVHVDKESRDHRKPGRIHISKQRSGPSPRDVPIWFEERYARFTDGALPQTAIPTGGRAEPPPDFSFNALDEESPL